MHRVLESYLLRGGSTGGFVGLRSFGLEDGRVEDYEGLHDASLMGIINQRGQGYRSPGWTGPHQRGPKHDAKVAGAHLVILFQLCDPGMRKMEQERMVRLTESLLFIKK